MKSKGTCGTCCWRCRLGYYNANWQGRWMCGMSGKEVDLKQEACKYHPTVYGGNINPKVMVEYRSLYYSNNVRDVREKANATETIINNNSA